MMIIRRRSFLQRGAATLGASIAPTLVFGNVGTATHPHPHQASYSPSHNLRGLGLEHSFLRSDSLNYAGMPGCRVIVEHHEAVGLPGFEQLAAVTEHVPFFVSSRSPIRDLTVDQIYGTLRGDITSWEGVGGHSGSVSICANVRNKRLTGAFLRVVGQSHRGGVDGLMNTLEHSESEVFVGAGYGPASVVRGSGYREAAAMVASSATMVGVGLRPALSRGFGLVPLRIDGLNFWSEQYPIQLPTYFYVRTEAEGGYAGSKLMIDNLTRMYHEDQVAIDQQKW